MEHLPVSHLMALLSKGANVNVKVKHGGILWNTPLHIAVMLDKYEHADILLRNNAGKLIHIQCYLMSIIIE